ncbi:MAG: ABC transporter permease [Cyclobacteriaceae bacterium]|nr:ABC transporter permease [Cyclobacteriaceae bacterium]
MKTDSNHPPKLFLKFFRWFCHPKLKNSIEGDLMELYQERKVESGKLKADLKFVRDVLLLFRPSIIKPSGGYQQLNNYGMLKNYFKIGIRNILKYKVFSFINIFGLAVSMSVVMLLVLMLADQHRYDQFHAKKDRVYRILSSTPTGRQAYATSPFGLASALREYPIIEQTTFLSPGVGGDVLYGQKLAEMKGYFAEPAFFNVFGFELQKGNAASALTNPNSIVISSEMAHYLFGADEPIGKVVDFSDRQLSFPIESDGHGAPPVSWGSFTVTGVIDITSYKSHLKFDALMSSSSLPLLYSERKFGDASNDWENYFRTYTYVLLPEKNNVSELQNTLNDFVKRKYADITAEQTKDFKLEPQRLTDIQLGLRGNDTNNRMPSVGYYFIGFLALAILLSAVLNYTNLSVARALTRAREIGVRKVNGALKRSIVFQFLSESVLVAWLSLGVALLLLLVIKPAFKNLWVNQYLQFELPQSISTYFIFIGLAAFIGLLAGFYPAVYLSRYSPISALKGAITKRGRLGFRKTVTVFQFVISLFFIVTSILVFSQFRYFMNFDYGFESRNVINIELQGNDFQKLSTELGNVPGVISVSGSDIIPATGTNNGIQLRKQGTTGEYNNANIIITAPQFVDNLNLKIVAGRALVPNESDRFILVNETAAKKWGYKNPQEIVGEVFESNETLEVIGVVKDFHYLLLINRDGIAPLVLRNRPQQFQYVSVKIASSNTALTISQLEAKWKQVDPIHSFQYKFYDDELSSTHQAIFDLVAILGFIAFLAVVIACLGLLGMTTYTTERKTKEVGIRKVMGASEWGLVKLLSRDYSILLIIAIVIGAPLSYFANNLWLQTLTNRVEFGWGILLLGIFILSALGVLTIGSQTWKASKKNPVESLRSE